LAELSKKRAFRMTEQRRTILEALRAVKTHPSADEIYETVRRALPRISLGTVYRNLEFLADKGVIQKLDVGGSQMRFDGNPKNHYHVRCVDCGRVADVDLPVSRTFEKVKTVADGFEILAHRLEFIGRCPACRRRKRRR
jgi:Fur family ferric uptake transcriptional regulator